MRDWYLAEKKPFPNEVDFDAVDKYRWIWLMLCAQLKHGGPEVCRRIVADLGGADAFGQNLFEAVDEMLDPEELGSWARNSVRTECISSKDEVAGSNPAEPTNLDAEEFIELVDLL